MSSGFSGLNPTLTLKLVSTFLLSFTVSFTPAMPSAGDVATGAAAGAVDSKLGGLASLAAGFGGFGRKKKQEKAEQPQSSPPAAQSGAGPAAMVLIESSTEMTSFSSAAIDPSRFQVPAGYKQVEPETRRQSR